MAYARKYEASLYVRFMDIRWGRILVEFCLFYVLRENKANNMRNN